MRGLEACPLAYGTYIASEDGDVPNLYVTRSRKWSGAQLAHSLSSFSFS